MPVTSEELSFGPAFLLNELDIGEWSWMNQWWPEYSEEGVDGTQKKCQKECGTCLGCPHPGKAKAGEEN